MTKIYAHRGASAQAPENTLCAFKLALSFGADGIETDCHISADDVIVLSHDENLLRCAGKDMEIALHTAAALREIDIAVGEPCGAQHIPLLSEFLSLCETDEKPEINLELKAVGDAFLDALLKVTEASANRAQVIFSSFHEENLAALRERGKAYRLGFLYDRPEIDGMAVAQRCGCEALHPCYPIALEKGYIERAHEMGFSVNTWTVNREEEMRALFALGVDGLITNDVPLAQRVRAEYERSKA